MLRDRKALMITVLMPTILTAILGLSIGNMMNGNTKLETIPIAVVNQSEVASFKNNIQSGETSDTPVDFAEIFIENILASEDLQDVISYEQLSKERALQKLENGKLSTVIFFPKSYNQEVLNVMNQPSSKQVEVTLYQNPDESLHNEVIKGVVESYTNQLSKSVIAQNTMVTLMMKEPKLQQEITSSMGEVIQKVNETNRPNISVMREPFGDIESLSGMQYFTAGMAVMFMLYVGGYSAIYVRDEIRSGTYNRLRSTGMSFWHLAGGKFISTALLVFLQIIFLFMFEKLVFGMEFTNIYLLLLMIVITALSVSCLSILLTTITVVNQETRLNELFQSVIIPFLAMVGGSFISISMMPEPIQMFGHNVINGAALQGFTYVMQGYSFSELFGPILALLINGLIFLVLSGLIIFRRKEVFR
nr:ABC transporter permease [Pontibacillus marinus]